MFKGRYNKIFIDKSSWHKAFGLMKSSQESTFIENVNNVIKLSMKLNIYTQTCVNTPRSWTAVDSVKLWSKNSYFYINTLNESKREKYDLQTVKERINDRVTTVNSYTTPQNWIHTNICIPCINVVSSQPPARSHTFQRGFEGFPGAFMLYASFRQKESFFLSLSPPQKYSCTFCCIF